MISSVKFLSRLPLWPKFRGSRPRTKQPGGAVGGGWETRQRLRQLGLPRESCVRAERHHRLAAAGNRWRRSTGCRAGEQEPTRSLRLAGVVATAATSVAIRRRRRLFCHVGEHQDNSLPRPSFPIPRSSLAEHPDLKDRKNIDGSSTRGGAAPRRLPEFGHGMAATR
jgi:hypothetical protein